MFRGAIWRAIKAIRAFDDYWSLGSSRTLAKLLNFYQNHENPEEVPTLSMATLTNWHDQFQWRAKLAEREAMISEKSEALMVDDRVARKNQRIIDQDRVIALSRQLIDQCRDYFTGYRKEVVAEPLSVNEYNGEIEYRYKIEMVPNLNPSDYIKIFPKAIEALLAAQREQKQELGEDTQRMHVTIEQVVNALPPQLQGPMREALYEELMAPAGVERRKDD
jgi:hypothetical protein